MDHSRIDSNAVCMQSACSLHAVCRSSPAPIPLDLQPELTSSTRPVTGDAPVTASFTPRPLRPLPVEASPARGPRPRAPPEGERSAGGGKGSAGGGLHRDFLEDI